jgi:hypothetical protein
LHHFKDIGPVLGGYSNSINHWKYITGWLRGLDDDTVRSGKRLAMVPLAALDL